MAPQMTTHRRFALLGLCFLLTAPTFTTGRTLLNRIRRDNHGASDDKHSKFSKDEFSDKLKKLLERDRPDRPDRPDDRDDTWETENVRRGLGNLFKHLEELKDRMPDDLTDFEVRGNAQLSQRLGNNACFKNPNRLAGFLSEVAEAVHEFREEMHEMYEEVAENAADVSTRDMDTPDGVDDVVEEVMGDLKDAVAGDEDVFEATSDDGFDATGLDDATFGDGTDDVTASDDTSEAFSAPSSTDDSPSDSVSATEDNTSSELDDVDMEDIFEKLSEDSFKCMSAFLDDDDEKMLCRQFSHQSYRVFEMFIKSGADCSDYLKDDDSKSHSWFSSRRYQSSYSDASGTNNGHRSFEEHFFTNMFSRHSYGDSTGYDRDDDDDDGFHDVRNEDLDDAHQMALLNQLMSQKGVSQWTSVDLRRAIRLAPDVLDADFLGDLDDDVFESNIGLLGRLAAQRDADPDLKIATRQRILQKGIGRLRSTDISQLGMALLTLSVDDLDEIDPDELLDADIDDIFKNMGQQQSEESRDFDNDDDDDDDEREGLRLALGQRMKRGNFTGPKKIGKLTRFMFDNLDFLESVDPDDLFDAVDELQGMTLDEDDAANLFRRMSESAKFPAFNQITPDMLRRMRGVLPGMSISQLKQLPILSLKNSYDVLKDIDFGETQARELVENLFEGSMKMLTASQIRGLGRLAKGLDADDIFDMDDNVISEVLDDFGDLELSDAQKRIIAFKALRGGAGNGLLKMMWQPSLAEVVSIDDIDDLNDIDVVHTLNASAKIPWRPSQAAMILNKVKQTMRGRSLRPADIPKLKNLASGLLLDDLDDMVDRPDDVDDLADVLGDQEDRLTSSQIDKVLELIEDKDDMETASSVKVTPAFVAQKGVFLAYLPPGLFNKLEFDDGAKKAFLALMSKMDTRKLPRAQLKFLAENMLDMMEDKVGENIDDADYRKQKELGEFFLGLSKSKIQQMSAKAIVNNMGVLGVLPLTKEQAEAVLDKIEEAEPNWKCNSVVLANAGPLLQFAKREKIEEICEDAMSASLSIIEKRLERRHEMVEERREEGLWREDSMDAPDTPDFLENAADAAEEVVDKMEEVTESEMGRQILVARMIQSAQTVVGSSAVGRRRRRAVTDRLKCSMLRLMRQDVSRVDVAKLLALPEAEFKDCLDVLGNATKWDSKNLGLLKQRATEVYGQPDQWSSEILRQAGILVAAMSIPEISSLQLRGLDAANSIAKHARLSVPQAAFSRWLELNKNNMIATITPGEFSALSELVCGLTKAQISELPLDVFKRSLAVIGTAKSCTLDQRTAYTMRAREAYGQLIANWLPAVVGDMGHLVGGLDAPTVQQLNQNQLALIRPVVVSQLPLAVIKAMTETQLQQMSTNQANALTPAQFSALNATQQQVVKAKATVAFLASTPSETSDGNSTETARTDSSSTHTSTSRTTTTTTTTTTTVKPSTKATTTMPSKPQRPVASTKSPVNDYDLPIDIAYEATTDAEGAYVEVVKSTVAPKHEATTAAAKGVPPGPRIVTTAAPPKGKVPEKAIMTTVGPKISKPVTTRQYVETTTRKFIAITVKINNKSNGAESSRGDKPWPNFHSNQTVSTSTAEEENSLSTNNMVSSSTSAAEEHGLKSAGGDRTSNHSGSGGGADMAVRWSLTSLLAVSVFASLLC